jgi:hypothetical protein
MILETAEAGAFPAGFEHLLRRGERSVIIGAFSKTARSWSSGACMSTRTLGYWSKQWAGACLQYNFSRTGRLLYRPRRGGFSPARRAAGHGPLNRVILQRILERGLTAKKLGYDPKYCAFTMVDLQSLMENNALANPYPA